MSQSCWHRGPQILSAQKIPPSLITSEIWSERCKDIRHFERYLTRNGMIVRKFFLNVSKEEQKKRFMERLENPEKNWKFSASDVAERGHWDRYMEAYEHAIGATATTDAPWFVVPADNKWFTRLVIALAIVDALASLDLRYPKLKPEALERLAAARLALMNEK